MVASPFRLTAILAFAVLEFAAAGLAATAPPLPPAPPLVPSPFILVDLGTGAVLAERTADVRRYPASVTKLMTAYLTFEALADGRLRLTSPVVESAVALAEPPSKMGFSVGTVFTVDNALKMLIVKSANDVAVALGETISGSKPAFVAAMNAAAARLGMTQTRFQNPNGLHDDEHFSTARDLAVLAQHIWTDFPQFRELFAIPAIRSGKLVLRSENALLERYRGANGMKTGYTCAAGFNLVATATRGDQTLLVVVLAETSSRARTELAAGLLDQGFEGRVQALAPSLTEFRSPAGPGGPIDLHDMVCKRHAPLEGDTAVEATSLGPAQRVMEPVKVFTGGADPVRPSSTVAAPAKAADPARTAVAKKDVSSPAPPTAAVADPANVTPAAAGVASTNGPEAAGAAASKPLKVAGSVPIPRPKPSARAASPAGAAGTSGNSALAAPASRAPSGRGGIAGE